MRTLLVGSLLLGAAAFSLSAHAQDGGASEDSRAMLEEIVVTARKVQESAQEVPVAITAITAELEQSSIRNLTDLNGYAPNVTINRDGGRSNGANINIRGISPTRSDDNSFDAPIAVMIDGVHLGSNAGQILENFDIERVEVLRGPQGTLFGKNTVGGVVNVIRSRPTGEFGGRFKVTGGENGQLEFRGVLNTSLVPEVLAAKFFVTHIEEDGYQKNITTGDDLPIKDYQNFGATLLWTPNDRFEATLTAERFKDKSQLNAYQTNYNLAPGVETPPTDNREKNLALGSLTCTLFPDTCRTSLDRPNHSENDTDNDADLETDALTLNMSYDLNDNMTLRSVTGYRDMTEWRIYDFDGASAPFITIERDNEYDQFSQELRLEAQWDRLSLIAGAYYWDSEFTQDWVTGGRFWATLFGGVAYTPPVWQACQGTNGLDGAFAPIACDLGLPNGVEPGGDVTQILYETQETTSVAFFTQMEYDLTDRLAVLAGIRWTEEKKHFIAGQSYLSNVERQWDRNFPGYADLKNKWTEVSPKLGATYRFTDDIMVYASYSEGFHSGGFFGVNQNIRDFERDQYDPEFAESWEVGLKSTWLENRLRVNIAGFLNDFTDKQESFVKLDNDTRTVATVFENAASVTYKGVEAEVLFAATENLRLFLNYGLLDAEYDEFNIDITPTDDIDNVVDASFLKPRNAPDFTLGLGFIFNYQIGPGELEVFAKWSGRGDQETDVLNLSSGRLAGGENDDLSATIGYRMDRWSFTVFGTNLTDERWEVPIVLGGSNTSAALFIVGNTNRPRHIGVEVGFDL